MRSQSLRIVLGMGVAIAALFATVSVVSANSIVARVTILGTTDLPPEEAVSTIDLSSSVIVDDDIVDIDESNNIAYVEEIVPLEDDEPYNVGGVISDTTNNLKLDDIGLVVYRSGIEGTTGCTSSDTSCYKIKQCDIYKTKYRQQRAYNCEFKLKPWADSTTETGRYPDENWVIAVVVPTEDGKEVIPVQTVREVESVLHVGVPSSIPFGTMRPGDATTADNNFEMRLVQYGNTFTNVSVSGENMTCDKRGSIPVERIRWSLEDVGYDDSTFQLSKELQETSLYIDYNDSGVEGAIASSLYWNLAIPTVGAKGYCSGEVTVILGAGDKE